MQIKQDSNFPKIPEPRQSVMHQLEKRFTAVIEDKNVREDYAFNCSDIFCEVLQFNQLIENILAKEMASAEDISAIEGFLAIHWHYHTSEMRKAMRRSERLEEKKQQANETAEEDDEALDG